MDATENATENWPFVFLWGFGLGSDVFYVAKGKGIYHLFPLLGIGGKHSIVSIE
jgi:hypothetical protein